MRRLVGWVGTAVGGLTAYRFLRRQRATEVAAEPGGRAGELREKLAESRSAAEEVVGEPAAEETEEPESPEEAESPDDRRRRVHEEGRAAVDEMQSE